MDDVFSLEYEEDLMRREEYKSIGKKYSLSQRVKDETDRALHKLNHTKVPSQSFQTTRPRTDDTSLLKKYGSPKKGKRPLINLKRLKNKN